MRQTLKELSQEKSLDELIPSYASNKAELDSFKKICDGENAQIKKLMDESNIDTYDSDGWHAVRSVLTRQSVNEEKLLSLLQNVDNIPDGLIKTKEYVDMDALEDAIYRGTISNDLVVRLDSCFEEKTVVTLKVSKIKPKKKEEE